MPKYLFLLIVLAACSAPQNSNNHATGKQGTDSTAQEPVSQKQAADTIAVNDTLNAIAGLIAGNLSNSTLFNGITGDKDYLAFSESFSKKWKTFDSTRITKLTGFRNNELNKVVKPENTLFYPFSGPDILYANLFFPEVEKYIMVGLEPVGTLPDFNTTKHDSLDRYYNKLNTSLNAILNFSFFRTESMSNDLRNTEVDGTIHLLFLFLNRTGKSIVSARAVTVDSLGNKVYLPSLKALKAEKLKTKGVEIKFKTKDNRLQELTYFSVNAADYNLQSNPGFVSYLNRIKNFNVYLKGASYLLHKATFKTVRTMVLNGATTVTQDDSGIALNYFKNDTHQWDYHIYGQYSKPIHMFAKHYQPLMDSLYRQQGAKQLDFGLGYNYRDKNSNFMIVTKQN